MKIFVFLELRRSFYPPVFSESLSLGGDEGKFYLVREEKNQEKNMLSWKMKFQKN